MKNFMKTVTKTILAVAVATGVFVPTQAYAIKAPACASAELDTLIQDALAVLSSPAGIAAGQATQSMLTTKLIQRKVGRGNALTEAFGFWAAKQDLLKSIVAKKDAIGKDLVQEVIRTVSGEELFKRLGITREMLEAKIGVIDSTANAAMEASEAELNQKNAIITTIFHHSTQSLKGLFVLLGNSCLAILSQCVYVEDSPLHKALRKTLATHLTTTELEAIREFVQTKAAHKIIEANFNKLIFVYYAVLLGINDDTAIDEMTKLLGVKTDGDNWDDVKTLIRSVKTTSSEEDMQKTINLLQRLQASHPGR